MNHGDELFISYSEVVMYIDWRVHHWQDVHDIIYISLFDMIDVYDNAPMGVLWQVTSFVYGLG